MGRSFKEKDKDYTSRRQEEIKKIFDEWKSVPMSSFFEHVYKLQYEDKKTEEREKELNDIISELNEELRDERAKNIILELELDMYKNNI